MDLTGKRALVMGVANDHSIAWGIARALRDGGCRLAFTHQGEAFGKRVRPLAEQAGAELLLDADVMDDASLDRLFADKSELTGRFVDTGRDNFRTSLIISCHSLIDLARRARPLMMRAGGGSIVTLTYQGSQRVTPHYNVMGVAKAALEAAVRYLAADLGPEGIRVNAISPGPMKTLAGAAIGGARATYRHTQENAPLLANATLEAIGGTAGRAAPARRARSCAWTGGSTSWGCPGRRTCRAAGPSTSARRLRDGRSLRIRSPVGFKPPAACLESCAPRLRRRRRRPSRSPGTRRRRRGLSEAPP